MEGDSRLGQIFSADFLVGIIVVLFVMTTLQVYNTRILEDIKQEERMIFQQALDSRTDTLLLFEGKPKNWSNETVEILGFSTGTPNELNETKLIEYFEMEDERAQNLLGFQGRNFYLAVENQSGNVIEKNGVSFKVGSKNWENAKNVYVSEREVLIPARAERASLRLVVW